MKQQQVNLQLIMLKQQSVIQADVKGSNALMARINSNTF